MCVPFKNGPYKKHQFFKVKSFFPNQLTVYRAQQAWQVDQSEVNPYHLKKCFNRIDLPENCTYG